MGQPVGGMSGVLDDVPQHKNKPYTLGLGEYECQQQGYGIGNKRHKQVEVPLAQWTFDFGTGGQFVKVF